MFSPWKLWDTLCHSTLAQRVSNVMASKFVLFGKWSVGGKALASGVFILLITTIIIIRSLVKSRRRARWQERAQKYRNQQREKISNFLKEFGLSDKQDYNQEILKATLRELRDGLWEGRWKCQEVLQTYINAAIQTHERLNCLTEILFFEAMERARQLDEMSAEERREMSLFGVPVSLKDTVDVIGHPTSLGTFRWADELRPHSALVYENLIAVGAIPFCKTNVPQTLMSFECSNPLWGRTENPHLTGFTPGGSSGGEAALIGGGGSVAGVGSDIGGSLRIPAHFSGICALKPSARTIPLSGCRGFHPASLIIRPVNGPMARNAEDLALLMSGIVNHNPDKGGIVNEIDSLPVSHYALQPAQIPPTKKVLRVGVLEELQFLRPLLPCRRALNEAVEALRAEGHEIVPFSFPFLDYQLVTLYYRIIAAEKGHFYQEALKDEPIEEFAAPFLKLLRLPHFILWLYRILASNYADPRPYLMLTCLAGEGRPLDAIELTNLARARLDFIMALNTHWKAQGLDCLLCPAFGTVAIPHGYFPSVSAAAAYTFIWNLVDWVVGVLPVTKVDPQQDRVEAPSPSDFSLRESKRLLEAELENAYNAEMMAGLPVGVQLVTPQYCEASALEALYILEQALKKHRK